MEAAVTLRCDGCGRQWSVTAKPDGTMPATSRCAKSQGGCGKLRKVPRRAAAVRTATPAATPAVGWDPPSEPRRPQRCDGPCPHCGAGDVYADPRGIVRLCLACEKRVIPPGVLAPYERGTGITRAARSEGERDDDAKQAVVMAGEFLRRVAVMLADPKIHPRSADILRWYDEEVTEARRVRDAARLAKLADEFTADQRAGAFRRLRIWQGRPARLDEDQDDDEDGYDDEPGYDDEDQDDEPASTPAALPGPPPVPDRLARRPVVLATPASIARQQQRAQPRCQVIERGAPCGTSTDRGLAGLWMCRRHEAALKRILVTLWQGQGANT